MEKTAVFNLIILDESGSMSSLKATTISGCNETISVARAHAAAHTDRENSFISIYAFQSGGPVKSRYIYKNSRAEKTPMLTGKEYEPCGFTPLYDAIGTTLVDLRAVASTHTDACGVVTIITDGMENDSKEFSPKQVIKLIEEMKADGWVFNFIGANIDVEQVSRELHIDNAMSFTADVEDTKRMFDDFAEATDSYHNARYDAETAAPGASFEERKKMRSQLGKGFFKKKK